MAADCNETDDTCGKCGGPHRTSSCVSTNAEEAYCRNCDTYGHGPGDRKCPQHQTIRENIIQRQINQGDTVGYENYIYPPPRQQQEYSNFGLDVNYHLQKNYQQGRLQIGDDIPWGYRGNSDFNTDWTGGNPIQANKDGPQKLTPHRSHSNAKKKPTITRPTGGNQTTIDSIYGFNKDSSAKEDGQIDETNTNTFHSDSRLDWASDNEATNHRQSAPPNTNINIQYV